MFLSCTLCTLNVHISICFCIRFRHAYFCMNDYPYYSCMGFRHAHFWTNDFQYYYCVGFPHAHLCTKDYPDSYGLSSFTTLYEWVSICVYWFTSFTTLYEWLSIFLLVFVMDIFVWRTINFIVNGFSSCKHLNKWLSIH